MYGNRPHSNIWPFLRPLEQVSVATARGVWASEAFLLVSREAYVKAGGHGW